MSHKRPVFGTEALYVEPSYSPVSLVSVVTQRLIIPFSKDGHVCD